MWALLSLYLLAYVAAGLIEARARPQPTSWISRFRLLG
jgi:hypothetical protein